MSVSGNFLVWGDAAIMPIKEPKERGVDEKGKYWRVNDGLPESS